MVLSRNIAATPRPLKKRPRVAERVLREEGGREVKHTGDGIMTSFGEFAAAMRCARSIQHGVATFNQGNAEALRIGIALADFGLHSFKGPPSQVELFEVSWR